LPWLQEVTRDAEKAVRRIQHSETDRKAAHKRIQHIVQHWAETVFKLGALPKRPFTVDFNNGADYYCWEYPEEDIYYRHAYHKGYAGRHRIEDES